MIIHTSETTCLEGHMACAHRNSFIYMRRMHNTVLSHISTPSKKKKKKFQSNWRQTINAFLAYHTQHMNVECVIIINEQISTRMPIWMW